MELESFDRYVKFGVDCQNGIQLNFNRIAETCFKEIYNYPTPHAPDVRRHVVAAGAR